MGDLILLAGLICALLTTVGGVAGSVWHLATLHPLWAVGDLFGACISAALVVTFDRAQRIRKD